VISVENHKIFLLPVYLTSTLTGFPLKLGIGTRSQRRDGHKV